MSKHTPGPWSFAPPADKSDPGGLAVEGKDGAFIADLWGDNQVADARLIAAAPEMLEALNEAVTNGEWSEGEQCGDWCISMAVYETLRDAIIKAEGAA